MRLSWRGIVGVIAGACLFVGLGRARAQSEQAAPPAKTGPALNWTRQPGAESCIASVELAARIEARVKQRVFVAAPEAIVAVEGYVAPEPRGGFRAVIAMSDGQGLLYGSRELRAAGACSELDDALVFVIAVTLRPEAGSAGGIELPETVATALDAIFGAEPTEPDPAAFPSAPQAPSAPPVSRKPEPARPSLTLTRARAQPRSVSAFIEGLGALQLELQPSLGLGGGGGLRVRVSGVGSFSVHGAAFAKTTREVRDLDRGASSRTAFTVRMLSAGYCTPALWHGGQLGLEACASGRLGSVAAKSSGFVVNGTRDSLFVSVGLLARLAFAPNDNVVLALAAGPELHLARPVFSYEPAEGPPVDLFQVGLVGGAAELSVAFALF